MEREHNGTVEIARMEFEVTGYQPQRRGPGGSIRVTILSPDGREVGSVLILVMEDIEKAPVYFDRSQILMLPTRYVSSTSYKFLKQSLSHALPTMIVREQGIRARDLRHQTNDMSKLRDWILYGIVRNLEDRRY